MNKAPYIIGIFSFIAMSLMYGWGDSTIKALKEEVAEQKAIVLIYEQKPKGGEERIYTPQFLWPILEGDRVPEHIEITSYYGVRFSPFTSLLAIHEGLDMIGILGAQIVAIADMEVVDNWHPPDGWWKGHEVMGGCIRYKLKEYPEIIVEVGHLSATYVKEGEEYLKGEVIGRQGNTGLVSGKNGGNHLHIGIEINGKSVNPLKYLENNR